MSDIWFPNAIKPLTSRNYSYGRGSNVVATPVGGGLPRMGLDLTLESPVFSLNFIMSDLDKQNFNYFYDVLINHGANSFKMNLDSGNGIEEHQCYISPNTLRFVRPSQGTWSVSMSMVAETTRSQLGDFCPNLYELYECYGSQTSQMLCGLGEVVEMFPDA